MPKRDWLKTEHPIYTKWKETWTANERRFRGGTEVLDELRRFDWEKKSAADDSAYKSRRSQATYVNFPDMHATIVTGHLNREAPSPDKGLHFGTLGVVGNVAVTPDRARDVYHNVDGLGQMGSQWDVWWANEVKLAQATGHRWIYVDAPATAPANREQELAGLRPYVTEFSPLAVSNWAEESGRFDFVVVKVKLRKIALERGSFVEGGRYKDGYLLLVRRGYTGLDGENDVFSGGGWWKFDPDLEYVETEPGKPAHGSWDSTRGEIPIFPFFYDRDKGSEEMPALSRPGLTALGQVAVSYMNLSSAADFDAWDAGQSITYLIGIPTGAHREVVNQLLDGSKVVGVPATINEDGSVNIPGIQDGSQGAVSSTVWEQRLANKWEEARVLAAMETTGSPDTSGRSKQISFDDLMSPRLANMAANLEQAQLQTLHLLELRYSGGQESPTAVVIWPRTFALRNIVDDVDAVFNAEVLAGVRNEEVAADLHELIEELGLESDPDVLEKIRAKYAANGKAKTEAENAARQALALAPGGGPPGPEEDEEAA